LQPDLGLEQDKRRCNVEIRRFRQQRFQKDGFIPDQRVRNDRSSLSYESVSPRGFSDQATQIHAGADRDLVLFDLDFVKWFDRSEINDHLAGGSAVAIEARNPASLPPLLERIQSILWGQFPALRWYQPVAPEPFEAAAMGGLD